MLDVMLVDVKYDSPEDELDKHEQSATQSQILPVWQVVTL